MSETIYTRQTMTRDMAAELVQKHGSQLGAARKIVAQCQTADGSRPTANAVRIWIQDALNGETVKRIPAIYDQAEADKLNQIKNLLEEANVPLDAIDRIDNVKIKSGFHEGLTKGEDGEPVISKLRSKNVTLMLSPKWEDGPKWPVVQPAPPSVVKYIAPTVIIPKGLRVEVVFPDTQIGYQRVLDSRQFDGKTESYVLQPIHDERAIDCAVDILGAVQPDGFTHLGDLLDFSEFSRYLQVEEFFRTTQPAIDYAHNLLARCKSAMGAPRKRGAKNIAKRYRLVDGNHDWKRLATYVQQNARAAFGLRPAQSTPETWPDLTVPHLLRLDELGFEHCGMWPGSEAWLVEGDNALVVVHDPSKKGTYQASVIAGHTHHRREQTFTVRTPFGNREFTLHEIGCLCSLERATAKGSIQRTRVPSDRGFTSGWTHGIAVIEILEETGQHRVEFVPIRDGVAVYRGQRFESQARVAA